MYFIIGGNQELYGPTTAENLRQWVAQGRADGQSMVQEEGSPGWKPLSSFPEFADLFPPGPVATPIPMSAPAPAVAAPAVPNYLIPAILLTLCCCPPFGVGALVYAGKVYKQQRAGDYQGALESSKRARLWCWLAFGFGAVFQAILWLWESRLISN
jgi:hypothetical protein